MPYRVEKKRKEREGKRKMNSFVSNNHKFHWVSIILEESERKGKLLWRLGKYVTQVGGGLICQLVSSQCPGSKTHNQGNPAEIWLISSLLPGCRLKFSWPTWSNFCRINLTNWCRWGWIRVDRIMGFAPSLPTTILDTKTLPRKTSKNGHSYYVLFLTSALYFVQSIDPCIYRLVPLPFL